ncbi:hypothetical protein ALI144C_36845 [Actinosynnema sp. ALI-1.44]|uniref:DUF6801 domain-containing protein n=1 Tax=Actinosynnema sp. ALI-1.44 TaxID=1933779 RepID=UPI00097C5D52|nr:DUF6801 domain-containing protein [Actinosynnema sp. ALI-1.44]ONI76238.1 hypothetical protein ALI144C_36845 [Actinosynnema sp. ALI-1.44]
MSDRSRFSGRRIGAIAAAALVAASMTVTAGSAVAAGPAVLGEISKNLTYRCTFPLVGPQDVTGAVRITLPDAGQAGVRIVPSDLSIDVELSANIVGALRAFQTHHAEGTAVADVDTAYDGKQLTLGLPGLKIPRKDIPPSGTLKLAITGAMPDFVVYEAGSLSLAAGTQFNAKVDTRKADNTPTALGVLNVPCVVKATTPPQDVLFANIPISGSVAETAARPVATPLGDISKTLTYSCQFPDPVGPQDVTGTLTGTIPDSGKVGQRLQITNLKIGAALNDTITNELRSRQMASVGGSGRADVDADFEGTRLTIGIPGTVAPIAVPATGPMTGTITPDTPSLVFRQPGTVNVAAGQGLNGRIDGFKADGSSAGQLPLTCTVAPGQDPHVASVPITA